MQRLRAKPAWVVVLAMSGGLIAVLLGLDLIDDLLLDTDGGEGEHRFLELDDERNLPNWVETLLFALAALPWLLLGWLERRRLWLAIGALMIAMSCEEEVGIHDTIEREVGADLSRFTWQPVIALAILVGFSVARRRLAAVPRMLLTFGMAALVVGQASSMINGEGEGPRVISALLYRGEEVGELLTAALVLAAGTAALEARDGVREAWRRLVSARTPA